MARLAFGQGNRMASELSWDTKETALVRIDDNWRRACALLATADIRVGGGRPWDMRVHHPATFDRILTQGSLGLGEATWMAGGIASRWTS